MKIILPPKSEMEKLMAVDPKQEIYALGRYYSIFKFIYLKRFKIILKLLGNNRYDNLLDIGFGSGIFFPSLKLRCENLYGLDNHGYLAEVKDYLAKEDTKAYLRYGSVLDIPFSNQQFDAIICLSVLEFITDTNKAIMEISRVAKHNAKIIIGAPVNNEITDFCYRLIGKKNQNQSHASDHKKIIEAIKKYLVIEKLQTIPRFAPLNLSLFFIVQAKNK